MSNFSITGVLHVKYDSESKTDSFTVREFVLKFQDGNYEQFAKFQLTQDRCELLDSYREGQEMTVHFNLRGREWQGKYFTTLNAWKLEGAPAPEKPAKTQEKQPEEVLQEDGVALADDLPF